MEDHYDSSEEAADSNLQIIRYSPFNLSPKFSSPWFDLRVFYVRISNFQVDPSTPEFLNLNHIPLSPDTTLEVNGSRSSLYSDGVPSLLRRDRVDKKSIEATFVSTDSIRTTGSIKFEVFDKEDLILSGVLEISNNGNEKRWNMDCEATITACSGFFKGKHLAGTELPTIEVYIAGCFSGTPVILTKSLQLSYRKKQVRKGMLDTIPEYETTDPQKIVSPKHDQQTPIATPLLGQLETASLYRVRPRTPDLPCPACVGALVRHWGNVDVDVDDALPFLQIAEYGSYRPESEEDYTSMYWRRTETMEGEDGELSWFNAGVRVGVGIGLGMCLGIGIGVGLLVRTYQSTTRNFKRRLL